MKIIIIVILISLTINIVELKPIDSNEIELSENVFNTMLRICTELRCKERVIVG